MLNRVAKLAAALLLLGACGGNPFSAGAGGSAKIDAGAEAAAGTQMTSDAGDGGTTPVECVPTAQCGGQVQCGSVPDGCNNTLHCGSCAAGEHCQLGSCVAQEFCGNAKCDPGETCSTCPADCACDGKCLEGACCVPSCTDKQCGDDGCGGTCGSGCSAG